MPEALEHLAADNPIPNDARPRLPRGVRLMHNESKLLGGLAEKKLLEF